MKTYVRWLLVVCLLAIPVLTVAARAPRPPRPVLTCDPYSVTSLRDLVWYTRHCRTKIVQEAVVTTYGGQLQTATLAPPTATPEGWLPPTETPCFSAAAGCHVYPTPETLPTWTPKPTYSYPTWPDCFKDYGCRCMGYPCPEDYTTTPGLGTPTPPYWQTPTPIGWTASPTATGTHTNTPRPTRTPLPYIPPEDRPTATPYNPYP